MNHHFRSYSEHQPVAQQPHQLSQANSIIRIHSDSQQSLDRLFNPIQTAVPLRDRQLPKSFFNPSYKPNEQATQHETNNNNNHSNNNHVANQSVHCRSMSFDQRPRVNQNFHMRTTSTLAPMPILASTNHSSHQSSNEFSNFTNSSHSANGWSSSGNSMEDLMAPNCEVAESQTVQRVSQQLSTQPQLAQHYGSIQQQQQQQQQQALDHQQAPIQQQAMQAQQPHLARPTFYNAGQVATNNHVTHACTNHLTNNLHSRSMSFDQRQGARVNQNFHMRTHSTVLAPMSSADSTNHSSHQSSHEFLNYPNQTNHNANGWSSSGYSTDDMTGANWVPGQPQQVHAQPVQQPIMQPQTLHHHQQQHQVPMQQQQPTLQQSHQTPQQLFYNV